MVLHGLLRSKRISFRAAFFAAGSLYFIFGFITCLNDILVPHLKTAFALTYARAALIQFSFFTAYFVMSMPSGWLVDRLGYQRGLVGGLLLAALGCLLFFPAAGLPSYPLFLLALFILASGITLLQVAANPYVALLGNPETAASRLTLAGAFNSLGTTLAPLFGSMLILGVAGATTVQAPYLALGAVLLILGLATALLPLPLGEAHPVVATRFGGLGGLLVEFRGLAGGSLGIFLYVGAEVAIGSFLVSYLSLPSVGGIAMAAAARYVSIYWGGAMVGRFLGAAIMRKVPPGRVLAFNGMMAMALVFTAVLAGGRLAVGSILAVGFFNSIMFPTIFSLAMKDRVRHLGQASGILCMAIVGGAVVPVVQGLLADVVGLRLAFLLPVLCYAYIARFGAQAQPEPQSREGPETRAPRWDLPEQQL
jgi:FHS family L-fucose permease-like MFS transporter